MLTKLTIYVHHLKVKNDNFLYGTVVFRVYSGLIIGSAWFHIRPRNDGYAVPPSKSNKTYLKVFEFSNTVKL